MKFSKISYPFLMAVSFAMLNAFALLLSSCGGGSNDLALTAGDKAVVNLVAGPWKVVSVTVDGVDKTSLFTGFTITFTKSSANTGGYSTANGGAVWPATGQWTIGDMNTAGSFLRSDGLEVLLTEITDTSLKMSLAWTKNTFGPGRIESISGQHVFVVGK